MGDGVDDEQAPHDRRVRACAAHLRDLKRAYPGGAPADIKPPREPVGRFFRPLIFSPAGSSALLCAESAGAAP